MYNYPDWKRRLINLICSSCGQVFLSNYSKLTSFDDYYKNYTSDLQPAIANIPVWFEETCEAISKQRLEFIKEFIREKESFLDIGCGYGSTLGVIKNFYKKKNHRFKGVNPEKSLALFGQKKFNISIESKMFEKFESKQKFSFVILDNVIEHFVNPITTLKKIYKITESSSFIYIVTNNLDQPHGFYWQNFFRDHTFTFSEQTLSNLLQICGFEVTKICGNGHKTFQGYHYPYIQCIAKKKITKGKINIKNDFIKRINHKKKYIKSYYNEDKWQKLLFENNYSDRNLLLKRFITFLFKLIKINDSHFLGSHTFPSEKYFFRRIIILVCQTSNDYHQAQKILECENMNSDFYILSKHVDITKFKLIIYPNNCNFNDLDFKTMEEFFRKLTKNYKKINEIIFIQLLNAQVKDFNIIKSLHTEYLKLNNDSFFVKIPQEKNKEKFAPEKIFKVLIAKKEKVKHILDSKIEEIMQEFSGVDLPEIRRRIFRRNKFKEKKKKDIHYL